MKCHEVETWMLTDETPNRPPAEVRSHLRSCAGCRHSFGRLVRLIHEVSTAPLPPVPAAARDKLLSSLAPLPVAIPLHAPSQPRSPLPRRGSRNRGWLGGCRSPLPWIGPGACPPRASELGSTQRGCRGTGRGARAGPASGPVGNKRTERAGSTTLNEMATDVREESLASARQGANEDLDFLVWLHARIR